MANTSINITLYPGFEASFQRFYEKAAFLAFQDLRIQLDEDQSVPFLYGTLNDSCHVYIEDKYVKIAWNTAYAAFQYFVPCNHYLGQHANATDHWLEKYLTGEDKDFIAERFTHHLEQILRQEGYIR